MQRVTGTAAAAGRGSVAWRVLGGSWNPARQSRKLARAASWRWGSGGGPAEAPGYNREDHYISEIQHTQV
eukprot:scaffold25910_cov76-Phaeocystis_antarctica.AAC.2